MESFTRSAAVAGTFYPDNRVEITRMLEGFFQKADVQFKPKTIKALIVPHAGYQFSGQTTAFGYKQLINSNPSVGKPHFVLIGPTHNYFLNGIVGCDYSAWTTPLGNVTHRVPVKTTDFVYIQNRPFGPEHCLEVQLPFLQYIYRTDFTFSGFLTGSIVDYLKTVHYFIQNYVDSTFIISSDLSHYLPQDEANIMDKQTIAAALSGDIKYFQEKDNVACGASGISIILEIARQQKWKSTFINYDTSATGSGDKTRVVGYAAIAFYI